MHLSVLKQKIGDGANLKVEVKSVCDIDLSRRIAHVLPHEVTQSRVAVGAVPLRQEDGVVEAQVFPAGHSLQMNRIQSSS